MNEQILNALNTLKRSPGKAASTWVRPYTPPAEAGVHQLAFFLKPEVLFLGGEVRVPEVMDKVLTALETWDFNLGAVRLLNGAYLKEHRIMDAHYGVLNTISKQGRSAITQGAEETLREAFAETLEAGAGVLGAHQFLERFPAFSALALSVLSDNLGSTKLGGGTYALPVNVLGEDLLVLNAFHPYQLEPYYDPANTMVVMELCSTRPWADLRQRFAGATNPAKAAAGSLRNQFLQDREALGLADVSPGANGIHLSAGPLEGMVELQRFLSEPDKPLPAQATAFGDLLMQKGATTEEIDALGANPTLTVQGRRESAFDLTEEMDAEAAAALLTGA